MPNLLGYRTARCVPTLFRPRILVRLSVNCLIFSFSVTFSVVSSSFSLIFCVIFYLVTASYCWQQLYVFWCRVTQYYKEGNEKIRTPVLSLVHWHLLLESSRPFYIKNTVFAEIHYYSTHAKLACLIFKDVPYDLLAVYLDRFWLNPFEISK
jgi:hypothetical protein